MSEEVSVLDQCIYHSGDSGGKKGPGTSVSALSSKYVLISPEDITEVRGEAGRPVR